METLAGNGRWLIVTVWSVLFLGWSIWNVYRVLRHEETVGDAILRIGAGALLASLAIWFSLDVAGARKLVAFFDREMTKLVEGTLGVLK